MLTAIPDKLKVPRGAQNNSSRRSQLISQVHFKVQGS